MLIKSCLNRPVIAPNFKKLSLASAIMIDYKESCLR